MEDDILQGAVIIDRGDGVRGHYCIGRLHASGRYWEYYNKGKWTSAGDVFLDGRLVDDPTTGQKAEEMLRADSR
jgi:hypothetical protein